MAHSPRCHAGLARHPIARCPRSGLAESGAQFCGEALS